MKIFLLILYETIYWYYQTVSCVAKKDIMEQTQKKPCVTSIFYHFKKRNRWIEKKWQMKNKFDKNVHLRNLKHMLYLKHI